MKLKCLFIPCRTGKPLFSASAVKSLVNPVRLVPETNVQKISGCRLIVSGIIARRMIMTVHPAPLVIIIGIVKISSFNLFLLYKYIVYIQSIVYLVISLTPPCPGRPDEAPTVPEGWGGYRCLRRRPKRAGRRNLMLNNTVSIFFGNYPKGE